MPVGECLEHEIDNTGLALPHMAEAQGKLVHRFPHRHAVLQVQIKRAHQSGTVRAGLAMHQGRPLELVPDIDGVDHGLPLQRTAGADRQADQLQPEPLTGFPLQPVAVIVLLRAAQIENGPETGLGQPLQMPRRRLGRTPQVIPHQMLVQIDRAEDPVILRHQVPPGTAALQAFKFWKSRVLRQGCIDHRIQLVAFAFRVSIIITSTHNTQPRFVTSLFYTHLLAIL